MFFDVHAFVIAAFTVGGVCWLISLLAVIFIVVYFKLYKRCCKCCPCSCCHDRNHLLEDGTSKEWNDMPSTNSSFEMETSPAVKPPVNVDTASKLDLNNNPYVTSFDFVSGLDRSRKPNTGAGTFVNNAFKFLDEI